MISDCLNSVLSQTFTDLEAIVVNDGSPDTKELEKVLAPFMNWIVYIKQENKRAAGARNTAIRQARGEFLAFLDSDDTWFPQHLALQMKLFEHDPTLDIVYADGLIIGEGKHKRFMERCPSRGEVSFSALVTERCQVAISTVLARKSTLIKVGLFDESLQRCDDYDMWLRAAFHGAKIGYSRQLQARFSGERPGSLGQSRAKMAEAYWMILDKAKRTLSVSEPERALISKRAAEIRANYQLEEAKQQLQNRQFTKAKELLTEANRHFRQARVSLAVVGLNVAPRATRKLMSLWRHIRTEHLHNAGTPK